MTTTLASSQSGLFRDDLESVAVGARTAWEQLRDCRIFVTGGTGFFGKWLLETFAFANAELELNAELVVLSRNPRRFLNTMPHLAECDCISLCEGDVRTFEFPAGHFSHVIHAATDASAALNEHSPETMFDVIVSGTKRVLEFCVSCGARRLLLVSSGAVYGAQPAGMTHVHEDFADAPNAPLLTLAYGQGKRVAEKLCIDACSHSDFSVTIARCFAFVGPHLPLDRHFAIGNFLRDALARAPIAVRDGRPFRSYMYAADLATWLWTILVHGENCRPYNVGSDRAISIADVARLVARVTQTSVNVRSEGNYSASDPPPCYVPDTTRARRGLGLTLETDLPKAIARTFTWYARRRAV
jgi:dTDP-glucose 4,6-dehydratase